MLYVLADSNAKRQLGDKPFKTITEKAKINFDGKDIIFFSIDNDIKKLNLFGNDNSNDINEAKMKIGGKF